MGIAHDTMELDVIFAIEPFHVSEMILNIYNGKYMYIRITKNSKI